MCESYKNLSNYTHLIGTQVSKKSNKPFKSGEKLNTVTSVVVHEQTQRAGFTFKEDDSVVECWCCVLINEQCN